MRARANSKALLGGNRYSPSLRGKCVSSWDIVGGKACDVAMVSCTLGHNYSINPDRLTLIGSVFCVYLRFTHGPTGALLGER